MCHVQLVTGTLSLWHAHFAALDSQWRRVDQKGGGHVGHPSTPTVLWKEIRNLLFLSVLQPYFYLWPAEPTFLKWVLSPWPSSASDLQKDLKDNVCDACCCVESWGELPLEKQSGEERQNLTVTETIWQLSELLSPSPLSWGFSQLHSEIIGKKVRPETHLNFSHHFLFISLSQSFDLTLTDHIAEVWNTDTSAELWNQSWPSPTVWTPPLRMFGHRQWLTDEIDTVFWSPQLLDQVLHILLQKRDPGHDS